MRKSFQQSRLQMLKNLVSSLMQPFSKSHHCRLHACTSAAMEKTDLSKAKSVTEPQPLEQPEKPLIPVVRRGRKRKDDRPRIDIDDQIQEANRLRLLMKKLAHAAQMVSRNGQRVKARLINKAAKLSVQELAKSRNFEMMWFDGRRRTWPLNGVLIVPTGNAVCRTAQQGSRKSWGTRSEDVPMRFQTN